MLGFQGLVVTIIDIPTMYLRRIFGTARIINLLIVVKFFTRYTRVTAYMRQLNLLPLI